MDDARANSSRGSEGSASGREAIFRTLTRTPLARQAIKFAMTTGLSACLSLGLPVLLVEFFQFNQRTAVIIGFACAYLFNVVVIRSFVFESQSHWARDLAVYVVTNGALRVVEFGAFIVLAEWFGVHYAAALVIVLAAATVTKFFAYRFVFR